MANKRTDLKPEKNILINQKSRLLKLRIDPRIFSLEVVFQAAYVFMDKAHIIITGDPKKEIIVELTPRKECSLERFGDDFNNELLNYAVYNIQSKRTLELRKMIIARALLGNNPAMTAKRRAAKSSDQSCECETALSEADYESDPLGIRQPWAEKGTTTLPETKEPFSEDTEIPWLTESENILQAGTKTTGEKANKPAGKKIDQDSSIKIVGKEARLRINPEVYPLQSILLASDEFREICWLSLEQAQGIITITMKPKEKGMDLSELGREFFTYLIGVHKDGIKKDW